MIPSGFSPWNSRISLQNSSHSSELPLVCRPDKSLWFLVVVFMALGVAFAFVPQSGAPLPTMSDLWAGVALVSMFTVPALCTAWYLMHCRISADARGLTFRGFFTSRFVAWSEIEDYELRAPTSQQSKSGAPRPYLKTGGKWRSLLPSFTGFLPKQPLLDLIERHATATKVDSWQFGNLRDDGDWPKIFEYRDTSGWKLVGAYLSFTFALFGLMFLNSLTYGVAPMLTNIALMWQFLSFWGRVGFVAMPLLICGLQPLLILAQYPAIKRRRHYLGQKIVATHEGVSLLKNSRETNLKWDEITSYHLETLPGHFQPNLCVIDSRRESIEFVSGISNTKTLMALVQNRAVNAVTTKWLYKNGADEDVLGGAASFYRSGSIGVGPKIHHYRTRITRIFLVFGLVMCVGFPFQIHQQIITGRLNNGRPVGTADTVTGIVLFSLVGVLTLLGAAAFLFSSVRCEDDGLRQHSFLGERFLRWDEIETLVSNGYYNRVSGQNRVIRFGLVADYQGLIAEIEKRSGVELKRDSNAV